MDGRMDGWTDGYSTVGLNIFYTQRSTHTAAVIQTLYTCIFYIYSKTEFL